MKVGLTWKGDMVHFWIYIQMGVFIAESKQPVKIQASPVS
jgi:hypothetical protein